MHLKSFVKRNLTEGALVFAGALLLLIQFAVGKHFLSQGGVDHTTIIGAPFDDVYIHCRYAANLLAGHGYSFNPGQILSADSSPLWVVLIAFGGLFTSHLDIVAILFSALAWLLLAPAVYRMARNVFLFEQSFSLAAGICMLLQPRMLAMALSGMETTFAALLVLLAVEVHIRAREDKHIKISEAIILGLGIALRPEFYLLVILSVTDWLYIIYREKNIRLGKLLIFSIPIFLSAIAVFSIPLTDSYGRHLLYHSSLVQGADLRLLPDFYYIGRSFYIIFEGFWWVLPLLFFYIPSLKLPNINREYFLFILYLFLLPVVQSFIAPQYRQFGRYVFPVIPLAVLFVISLIRRTLLSDKANNFFRRMKDRKRSLYFAISIVIISLPLAVKWTHVYAESIRNINDQHLAVASWINVNIPSNGIIAVDDVGAIGYFTNRKLIDLTGLVSPEIFPLQKDQTLVWNQARRQGANIFIIYTRLNPTFYQYAKDSLELVNEFRVREPLVVSADTVMSVFKIRP